MSVMRGVVCLCMWAELLYHFKVCVADTATYYVLMKGYTNLLSIFPGAIVVIKVNL